MLLRPRKEVELLQFNGLSLVCGEPRQRRADIVGHDWGAAVAWFTATAHPNRVHKLVILSVPHPFTPPF
jgi:pimeloyl-ACP methyl ester carboxylesterase